MQMVFVTTALGANTKKKEMHEAAAVILLLESHFHHFVLCRPKHHKRLYKLMIYDCSLLSEQWRQADKDHSTFIMNNNHNRLEVQHG